MAKTKRTMPFALAGELTIYRAAELRGLLLERLAAGDTQFDLAGVTEFDSAGLQLLIAASRSAAARGRPLQWIGASPAVREVCATCGLDERFEPGATR